MRFIVPESCSLNFNMFSNVSVIILSLEELKEVALCSGDKELSGGKGVRVGNVDTIGFNFYA